MNIGLEAIAFHTPHHYIDLTDLATARGIDPAKYVKGLGQRKMAIATPPEDTVYLAVNAARKALEKFDIDPSEIGTMVVGTESGVDHSKPVAVYVHQALGLRSNCNTYETKHACFGATAAISSAADWIASGRAKGSKALIIAADLARYGIETAGEPTQGAGAVAMVISDQPSLLELDPDVRGHFTKQVMDFWRPLYRKEAITDGHYSIACYLEALAGTLTDAQPEMPRLDQLQACLYHVPFVKMALKAHYAHHEYETGQTIGTDSELSRTVIDSHAAKTAPWLTLNSDVGNIYTGSLFLSIIDMLRQGEVVEGEPISLFSYGSGCAASMSVVRPSEGYRDHVEALDPSIELGSRVALSVDGYEKIMRETEDSPGPDDSLNPADWGLGGEFLYLGNKDHMRQYAGLA